MGLEPSEVGTVVEDKVGDDSRGCIMKGLREPLKVLGKGGVTDFLPSVVQHLAPRGIRALLGVNNRSRRQDLT